eukprot:EG_transcript_30072
MSLSVRHCRGELLVKVCCPEHRWLHANETAGTMGRHCLFGPLLFQPREKKRVSRVRSWRIKQEPGTDPAARPLPEQWVALRTAAAAPFSPAEERAVLSAVFDAKPSQNVPAFIIFTGPP